jgi:hypothetical protein
MGQSVLKRVLSWFLSLPGQNWKSRGGIASATTTSSSTLKPAAVRDAQGKERHGIGQGVLLGDLAHELVEALHLHAPELGSGGEPQELVVVDVDHPLAEGFVSAWNKVYVHIIQ